MNSVHVLYDGYSRKTGNTMTANCSCTLIKGPKNVLVDCMTAWDRDKIIEGLAYHNLTPSMIDFCVATHSHSDHLGNLNLFLEATHVVGYCISRRDVFFDHPFDQGVPYRISDEIEIVATPGHTAEDVSVYVKAPPPSTSSDEVKVRYVVAGDIFEREEDILNRSLWEENSADPDRQIESRRKVIKDADFIIPGHGPMFRVTPDIRKSFAQTDSKA